MISFAEMYPSLIKEWHPSKNGNLTPDKISYGSGKIVWWICACGHEWDAPVYSRGAGNGCPYCSGRRPICGENDLATVNPTLAREWHPAKNGDLTPENVLPKSSRKVWWICAKGHEWQAVISSRSAGAGCPVCANKKVLAGVNDLATTNPSALSEWCYELNEGIRPQEVTVSSAKRVWWQCDKGHRWESRVADHSKGVGCPYCANKRVLAGFNDLATTNPELAAEWHPSKNGTVKPTDVIAGSRKKYWWLCPLGHEWQAALQDRNAGAGCHVCAKEMQTSFPEQAIFWYLSKLTKAVNRAKLDGNECDIYLPNIRSGIEYNSLRYHRSTQEKDATKRARLNKLLNRLITIEETGGQEWSDATTVAYRPDKNYRNLEGAIRTAIELLGLECNVEINIDRDRLDIYQAYVSGVRERSLAKEHPELAEEWNVEKNGFLKPTQITSGSNKKVWWICASGHEYRASVSNRSAGKGCPYCSGQKVLRGYNDLETIDPSLAKQWDRDLNGDLLPSDVSVHSTKRVWWKCEKGHTWQSTVGNRSEGYGCPYCSNQRVLSGYNDLATLNPKLAAEWHPTKNGTLNPSDLVAGSHKKVWWRCSKGHEWQAPLSQRNAGSGCPYCSNVKVLPGYNDLATIYPALAMEWHPTKNGDLAPENVVSKSNKKAWWVCANGHEWQATISGRAAGSGCPYCSNKQVLRGYNDLATINPSLAAEWHPAKNGSLKPSDVMAGSSKKAWWVCANGHEWQAVIGNRSAGVGCPVCNGQKVEKGFNDLETANPKLAAEWNYEKNKDLSPADVRPKSNKKVWWRCANGHEWEATVNSRSAGNGCPFCSGRKAIIGENDLATVNPRLASEWDYARNAPLKPSDVSAGSSKKVWWKCTHGHEWEASISSRSGKRHQGCPYCSNRRVLSGYNDLATTNPTLAAEWHPSKNGELKPADVVQGSNKKVWWVCPNGHEWQAVIAKRSMGSGCPICRFARKPDR